MNDTYLQASQKLIAAINKLDEAFKAASTLDAKDKIYSAMEVIQDELNALIAAGLKDNAAQYEAQTQIFKDSKAELEKLKNQIDTLISFIKIASEVISTLSSVIALIP